MNFAFFKNKKVLIIIAVGSLLLVAGFFLFQKFGKNAGMDGGGESADQKVVKVREVMVVIRDQINSADPAEDAKYALKRGDVIAAQDAGHEWSQTEYISYLLVKMNISGKQANELLQPLEKDTGEKSEDGRPKTELVRARKFKIDLDKVGFTGAQVVEGQPLKDKVFDESVIVEK